MRSSNARSDRHESALAKSGQGQKLVLDGESRAVFAIHTTALERKVLPRTAARLSAPSGSTKALRASLRVSWWLFKKRTSRVNDATSSTNPAAQAAASAMARKNAQGARDLKPFPTSTLIAMSTPTCAPTARKVNASVTYSAKPDGVNRPSAKEHSCCELYCGQTLR